jgi:glycosyltransferase involved in cell wall biosynthesis
MAAPTTFTIAIPTHARRETALLAARSALAQTRPPDRVLILCDACTDGTQEAMRALRDERVTVLDLPKAPGYGYAHRNRSLAEARTDVILWLGDDDLLLPDHLERLGELWDAAPLDLVLAPAVTVGPRDELAFNGLDWSVPGHRAAMEHYCTSVMASVSVRVRAAREAGGWNAGLERGADYDLWLRLLRAGARAAMTYEPTVLHFTATGRVQAWPDRIAQNTRWLERLRDPERLAALRHVLRRTRAEREDELLRRCGELLAENAALHAAAGG